MTPDELRRIGTEWFGERGWQSKLAALLGVDRSAVTRWMQTGAIPGPAIAAIRCWEKSGLPDGPTSSA